MRIESIQSACENYFNMFNQLRTSKGMGDVGAALLKIFSLFTVIVPVGVGLVYGATKLYGRIQPENPPSERSVRIKEAARPVITSTPSLTAQDPKKIAESLVKQLEEFSKEFGIPDALEFDYGSLQHALGLFSESDINYSYLFRGKFQIVNMTLERMLQKNKDFSGSEDSEVSFEELMENQIRKKYEIDKQDQDKANKGYKQVASIMDGLRKITSAMSHNTKSRK